MLCGSTQIWPQPTGPVQLGSHHVSFYLHQFRFETSAQEEDRELLQQAFQIFRSNIQGLVGSEIDTWAKTDINEFLIKVSS